LALFPAIARGGNRGWESPETSQNTDFGGLANARGFRLFTISLASRVSPSAFETNRSSMARVFVAGACFLLACLTGQVVLAGGGDP
jgi:hypothetical protein